MKLSPNKVKNAILQEAVNYKKKREIYEKAKQLNEEAKRLNEMASFQAGLGPGFANSTSNGTPTASGMPAQVLGMMTSPDMGNANSADLNTVGSLNDLYSLDMEMSNEDEPEVNTDEESVDELKKELEELKRRFDEIDRQLKEK